MISEKKLEKESNKVRRQERRKTKKKIKAFDEIFSEILKSKRNFFRAEADMEEIIEKKIQKKIKELKLKEGFTPEELDFLKKMALISQRDAKMLNIFCDWIRNKSTVLGGFAKRIYKLCKKGVNNLDKLPKIKIEQTLNEIKDDAKIISDEIKSLERTLNNQTNKKNKGVKK